MLSDYKKSIVGKIPQDWNVVPLGDVALNNETNTFIDGDWVEARYLATKGVRLIQTGNIGVGNFKDKSNKKYISKESFDELKCKNVHPGDILICRLADPIGRACIVPNLVDELITAVDVTIFRPDTSLYSKEYLNYYMNFNETLRRISAFASGSTRQRISRKNLSTIPIAAPKLKEQQKIAAILTSVDEAIEKTEAIIEQTEKVKKGLMQELLTKGIGHTEFKETEIGQIPDEWKLISLEDLTIESAFGPRFPSDKYDIAGNYALLRTTDINKSGNINYQTMPLTKLPEENFEKHVLKENDLLITRSGTCGIVTIFKSFEVPVIPGAFLIRFRLNEMVNPEFAKLFMMSNVGQSKIQTMASGGVQKNLSGTNLKKLILPLPTTQEQEKIIAIHKSMEEKISKEEKILVYFQKLKLALMQVLLTGKVRVQVDDPEVIHS